MDSGEPLQKLGCSPNIPMYSVGIPSNKKAIDTDDTDDTGYWGNDDEPLDF